MRDHHPRWFPSASDGRPANLVFDRCKSSIGDRFDVLRTHWLALFSNVTPPHKINLQFDAWYNFRDFFPIWFSLILYTRWKHELTAIRVPQPSLIISPQSKMKLNICIWIATQRAVPIWVTCTQLLLIITSCKPWMLASRPCWSYLIVLVLNFLANLL